MAEQKDLYVNGYKAIISEDAKKILGGGSAPTYVTANVTPTTSAQELTPDEGEAYNKVVVDAVTSDIDANIIAGNIKDGVTILGVTGNYTGE